MTLLAAWNYSGAGSTIVDRSGNGRDFILTGTSARTALGGGYTYGGAEPNVRGLTQGSAEIQSGPAITGLNTAARTVMTWARTAPGDPSWFLEYHRNAEDTGVFGWLYLSGTLRGRAKNAADTPFEINTVTDGAVYHHFALTHDGATLRLYRDGVLVGSSAMASAVWSADILRIFTNAGPGVILSETRIFDEALDATAIAGWMTTPISDSVSVTLGTAVETDTAHPMGWSSAPALGSTAETDTAHPASWSKQAALGVASEIGTAHPMTWSKLLVLGAAGETDTAHKMNFPAGGPYNPVTDPESVIRPNLAGATIRPNRANAAIRSNPAGATL